MRRRRLHEGPQMHVEDSLAEAGQNSRGVPADMGVVSVGLPRSGNRLLVRLANHHGVQKTGVNHFAQGFEGRLKTSLDLRLLLPVREKRHEEASYLGRAPGRYAKDAHLMHYEHFHPVLWWAAREHVPLLVVAYEAVVSDPDTEGRRIIEWLGLEWRGWPEPVYDANEKYLATPSGG